MIKFSITVKGFHLQLLIAANKYWNFNSAVLYVTFMQCATMNFLDTALVVKL